MVLLTANVYYFFEAAAFVQASLQEIGKRWNGTSNVITVPEGHYVELRITFTSNDGFVCPFGHYFVIRDGSKNTDELLGEACSFYKRKEYVFRSSGNNMWLKLHSRNGWAVYQYRRGRFHARYKAKPLNLTGMYSVYCFLSRIHPLLHFYEISRTNDTIHAYIVSF